MSKGVAAIREKDPVVPPAGMRDSLSPRMTFRGTAWMGER